MPFSSGTPTERQLFSPAAEHLAKEKGEKGNLGSFLSTEAILEVASYSEPLAGCALLKDDNADVFFLFFLMTRPICRKARTTLGTLWTKR